MRQAASSPKKDAAVTGDILFASRHNSQIIMIFSRKKAHPDHAPAGDRVHPNFADPNANFVLVSSE